MAIKILKEQNLGWINIDQVDADALAFLKKNYNFHKLDYEDLQTENHTPKIDSYNNYLFVVLQFPHWRADQEIFVLNELDIFIGDNYLITVQNNKTKEMKNSFYKCLKNKNAKKDWMGRSSGYLLYKLIEALYHDIQPILNNMGKKLSEMETDVFAGEQNSQLVKELGLYRRNIMHLRRILDPQRYVIATLSHTRRAFLDESLSLYFDNVTDHLNKLWAIVDTYRETVEGLHVTIESLIKRRTNKVISALTIISVSLLPLTLLSGIYGMNINGLPYAGDPLRVLMIFIGLAVVILLVILLMRNKKWL